MNVSGILLGIAGGEVSLIAAGDVVEIRKQALDLAEAGHGFDRIEFWPAPDANEMFVDTGTRKGMRARLAQRQAAVDEQDAQERAGVLAKRKAALEAELAELAAAEQPAPAKDKAKAAKAKVD